jgi:RND family efflux transporter MFP subunit
MTKNTRLIGPLCLALAWIAGCSDSKTTSMPVAPTSATVVSHAPAAQPLGPATGQEFIASGPIVVEDQLDVKTQREGMITHIHADVGTAVRRGQLLAQLDDRQVSADRDAAADKVKSLEADVKGWEYETKVLQSDLDRAEAMMKADLITKEALEHDRYKVEADKFETERARQNLLNSQDTLKSLEFELEKTRIVAPFDGVVARRYVREGQKVAAGDRVFWVTAVAPLRIKFTLPERLMASVKNGEQLSVTSAAAPDEKYAARVISVSPVVDPSSGTVEIVAELLCNTGGLRPGMTANIHLNHPQ